MRENETYRSGSDAPTALSRFGRWLASRPIESWGFFAAGVVIARLLF